ncbi:hypothetical protein KIPB_000446 [Kipferlia bialata]|uniref:Uncharacterized protein n=1 Tax=Kipferlia bialata TaxID=797122 RepID=A0A9K3GEZ2_9EUKA|nr:hypothetical protein KIPB_000446 [Kipferlia bialata]|eukprot:g446.t1
MSLRLLSSSGTCINMLASLRSVRPSLSALSACFSVSFCDDTELAHMLGRYPDHTASAVVPLLLMASERTGITDEVIAEIARETGSKASKVSAATDFYHMLNRHAPPKHDIKICTSPSCALGGSEALLAEIQAKADICNEGIPEGDALLVGVGECECLGACCSAPAAMVDGYIKDHLYMGDLDTIFESCC